MITLDQLKNLVKKQELEIISVEADKIPTNVEGEFEDGYTLTLKNALPEVKSTILQQGKHVVAKNVTQIFLIGKSDVQAFLDNSSQHPDEEGTLIYNGSMKLDVSRPKYRQNPATGLMEVSAAPRVFLTETTFNKRGAQMRQARAKQQADLIGMFLEGGATPETINNGIKVVDALETTD